ncbi:hypothetical protein L202_04724 [Cryptococcus amylolentus CBS 6039]|uniref:Uncharacterized protein n=2 Tax=Cryptococcus amylolentus TaxID=104669 RepID=A0A1E3HMH9_9TREE|nr:hypothetical protein L202_04724 [Cryptococcus amylolentus CBS 6039]ODN77552.1 hypothetical protein L202_04724 [Cryptococcus amylolentus CBS 6039]ODO05592.1 hypothetical protein I350_04650 [Cryptococcus amylolentus CBS 6273]
MTTSITDARFTVLHRSLTDTLSLSFDDPPETGWSVMPGYDESIPIPFHLEPPRLDADETLPSQMHPSYPFGRPVSSGKGRGGAGNGKRRRGRRVGDLLGTVGGREEGGSSGLRVEGFGARGGLGGGPGGWGGGGDGDGWEESGLREIVEKEKKKEVPPGMAGAKRPPTPPSPSLHPNQLPLPRSGHLRRQLERQQLREAIQAELQFDGPVPNEVPAGQRGDETEGEQGGGDGGQQE